MRSSLELSQIYRDDHELAQIVRLYSLSRLFSGATRLHGFTLSDELDKAIVLNPQGEEAVAWLRLEYPEIPSIVARFATFLKFGHRRTLIDLYATDPEPIASQLRQSIKAGKVRYPWIFGHLLYDRAFEFDQVREELTISQRDELLNAASGVFQMGPYLVGPLGLTISEEKRALPPRQALPLWHCSSPSCGAIHSAVLPQDERTLGSAVARLEMMFEKKEGVEWKWSSFFRSLVFNDIDSFYDDFCPIDLPWFLGNAFSERERRQILSTLLASVGRLRAHFTEIGATFRGSNQDIVERLDESQTMQAILAARDADIIAAVDRCIDARNVVIPLAEVRKTPVRVRNTFADPHYECSRLGSRIVGNHLAKPTARMKRLIRSIYQQEADARQLAWRLRLTAGKTLGEKLENSIATESPAQLLQKFVFVSEEKLKAALDHLHAPHLYCQDFDESSLMNKILWRIGFEPSRFESYTRPILAAVRELREVGGRATSDMDWKERIRRTGVNVFVYLEELLDRTLCFSTWLALGDHFGDFHQYDPSKGRGLVSSKLSGVLVGKDGPIVFDSSGKNTLFPLISGFEALRLKCEEVLNDPPSGHERPASGRPHYETLATLQFFPYRHVIFILDLPEVERTSLLNFPRSTYETLNQSGVMNVRNRIDHSGGAFPSAEEIGNTCDTLESVVLELESFGLVPSVYTATEVKIGQSGLVKILSKNDSGIEVAWAGSPVLRAIGSLPDFEDPQIIVPKLHVLDTAEPLRFKLTEDSEFVALWKGFPRRRAIDSRLVADDTSAVGDKDTQSISQETVQ